MKIKLDLELNLTQAEELEISKENMKEELTQMFFEICEDWVLRGQKPNLEYEN